MRSRIPATLAALAATLALSGCGYVHLGRLPEPKTTVIGDDKLMQDNTDLRTEKKILQQELALTRAQGEALRMALENRAADGDVSKQLVDRLNESSRELAVLRASYAKLQTESTAAARSVAEATALKAQLGATEEKLATSLHNFTALQDEVTRLRTDVASSRAENVALSEKLKTAAAENAQAQAVLAQLNTDLLAQKDARLQAEQDVGVLRGELKSVAPNSSVLAQLRTGAAGSVHSFSAEQAAENLGLKQQLIDLRAKVETLEAERTQLKQQVVSVENSGRPPGAGADPRLENALQGAAQLRSENEQLKAAAPQLQSLQEQLHDAQARATSLLEENNRLRSRISKAEIPRGEPARVEPVRVEPTPAPAPPPAGEPGVTHVVAAADANRIDLGTDQPPASAALNAQGPSGVNAMLVATVPTSVRAQNGGARIEANGQRFHIVAGGDTLAKISTQYYGTPSRWSEILAANRDVLGESNNLVVGRTLKIP
jgi:nucleoid-associated protein YgaU